MLANQRHDLITLSIADPREARLPPLGLMELEDAETGEVMVVDSQSITVRSDFEKIGRARKGRLNELFRSIDVDQVEVETDRPYIEAIHKFFKMRERKLR